MNILKLFFDYDELHARMDVRRSTVHIVTILLAGVWAANTSLSLRECIMRGLLSFGLLTLVRIAVCRLAASRLSSLAVAVCAVLLFWYAIAAQLIELAIFSSAVIVVTEYFKTRTKALAVTCGLALGLFAALLSDEKAVLLLVMALAAVLFRSIWHGVLERLSKPQLVLFMAKTLLIFVLSLVVYSALHNHINHTWSSSILFVGSSTVLNGPLVLVVALLVLRGVWATMLLPTLRSPLGRGLRLFYVVFSVGIFGAIILLDRWGDSLFLPQVMEEVNNYGLSGYSVFSLAFPLYALALLVTAGIDRWLFKDLAWVRALRAKL